MFCSACGGSQIPKLCHQLLTTSAISWNHFLETGGDFKSFRLTITTRSLVHVVDAHMLPFSLMTCEDRLCGFLLQRSSGAASLVICGGVGVCGCPGLDSLHVIGWKHSEMAFRAEASPPALVYHLDPCDDFVGIERDLCVISSLVVI